MKKFSFRLEKILQYREQLQEQRLRAYAAAARALERRRDELEALGRELCDYRTRMAELGVGRTSARSLAVYRSYLSHCEARVAEAAGSLEDAARKLQQRRAALVEATRERKKLEKLKSARRSEHDYQAMREETRELDEIAVKRFAAGLRTGEGAP